MRRKSSSSTLSWALLVLCYLEALFWTTCLLSSFAAVPGSRNTEEVGYLQRETGNLKLTKFGLQPTVVPTCNLELSNFHKEETRSLQRLAQSLLTVNPAHYLRPGSLSLNLLPVVKGVPGPYSGIAAID